MNNADKFTSVLDKDEKLLWTGKPAFLPFILDKMLLVIAGSAIVILLDIINLRHRQLIEGMDIYAYIVISGVVFVCISIWLMIFYKNMFYCFKNVKKRRANGTKMERIR